MSTRVSSNLTLVLKIFLPTLWIAFFGLLTVAIFFSSGEENLLFGDWTFKLSVLGFFLVFLFFIYFTLMKLLRVEFSDPTFSASNYFQTYQYRYEDIDKIKEYNLILKTVVCIKMRGVTKHGKNIYFLKSKAWYNDFVAEHPHIFTGLLDQED